MENIINILRSKAILERFNAYLENELKITYLEYRTRPFELKLKISL